MVKILLDVVELRAHHESGSAFGELLGQLPIHRHDATALAMLVHHIASKRGLHAPGVADRLHAQYGHL